LPDPVSAERLPPDIQNTARRKLRMLNNAGTYDVEIVDYH